MKNPILIERKDDKEDFVHIGKGIYRAVWGVKNNSISKIPLSAFEEHKFNFYYK